ncbi:MAG: peptidoglycan-binding protein, partial [Xanthomonadales bacterium]|nr:peptidoglycan-binding protein [Xanthomonadales bacterium]
TNDERRLAGLQRLYNLGFGKDDTGGQTFAGWTDEDATAAITLFQQISKLPQSGVIDDATASALLAAHGS